MADYNSFITKVNDKIGIDLNFYKEAQMKRRLTSLRNKRGFNSFSEYFSAMLKDEALLDEFVDRMTINVSEFYRNPKRWEVLQDKVIPKLIKNNSRITIWSAACSTGEEPYSLAMMLNEYFSNVQPTIIATDIDDKVLEKAKKGIYNEQALKNLPENLKKKYFTFKNDKYYVDDGLKKMIEFKKHDLLKDSYPNNVDLIVCRNVLIYFTDEAKETIYHKFGQSLVPNGILFVGSTEQIFNSNNYNLSLYDTFFYEKT